MGYTHYFTRPEEIPKPTFEKILADFKKVIPKIDADLGDPHGEHTEPILTADEICFNGLGEEAYETMSLPRVCRNDGELSTFCKTGREPYDEAVCALLIIAKHHMGSSLHVESDGGIIEDDEWLPAINLVKNELGIDCDIVFEN